MFAIVLPLTALLAGTGLLLAGSGLLGTLLAVRGGLEGFDAQTLGWVMSGYFVGYFLGTFLAPALIGRIGHIRAFAFYASLCAATVLLHPLWIDPWFWAALRILTGLALVGLYTVIESWLNAQSPPELRGRVFAIYMAVNLAALAAGQALLMLGVDRGFALFNLVAVLICLASLPVTMTRLVPPELPPTFMLRATAPRSMKVKKPSPLSPPRPSPNIGEGAKLEADTDRTRTTFTPTLRLGLRRLYRMAPAAAASAGVSGLAMGAFWGLGAVYANDLGLGRSGVATLMIATIVGGAALQWPLGRWSDRGDRRIGLIATCVAAGIVAATTPLVVRVRARIIPSHRGRPWAAPARRAAQARVTPLASSATPRAWSRDVRMQELILARTLSAGSVAIHGWLFLYGGLAFSIYPMAVAHLLDYLPRADLLAGSSSLLLLHGVGAALGPALAGIAMGRYGASALPLFYAGVLALLVLYLLHRVHGHHRERPHPANFHPMLRTTPGALQLLPETPQPTQQDPR